MKNNIIVLSGGMLSGKSTVADYLQKNYNYSQIAFADKLKHSLWQFLDNVYHIHIPLDYFYTAEGKHTVLPIKFPEGLPSTVRGAMQWWGEMLKNQLGLQLWVNQVIYEIKTAAVNIVISDARFIYEIDGIKYDKSLNYNYNIYTIKIESDRTPVNNHISETHFKDYKGYDFMVENNGSLEELYHKIDDILLTIRSR